MTCSVDASSPDGKKKRNYGKMCIRTDGGGMVKSDSCDGDDDSGVESRCRTVGNPTKCCTNTSVIGPFEVSIKIICDPKGWKTPPTDADFEDCDRKCGTSADADSSMKTTLRSFVAVIVIAFSF